MPLPFLSLDSVTTTGFGKMHDLEKKIMQFHEGFTTIHSAHEFLTASM